MPLPPIMRVAMLRFSCLLVISVALAIPLFLACFSAQSRGVGHILPFSHGRDSSSTVFRGGVLIDGTGRTPVSNAVIVVYGEQIVCVGTESSCTIPPNASVIDCRGRWIIPGLIDTHLHLAWMWNDSATRNQIRPTLTRLLGHGITGLREASGAGRERELIALRDSIATGHILGPRLFVSGVLSPQNKQRYDVQDVGELVRQLVAVGVDGFKIRLGVAPEELNLVIEAAHKAGRPIYVHPGNLGPEVVFADFDGVMHVSQIGPVPPHRVDEVPAVNWDGTPEAMARLKVTEATRWLLADEASIDSVIASMVRRGAWLEPTLSPPDPNVPWASYLASRDWETLRTGYQQMLRFVHRFYERDGLIVAGTDEDVRRPALASQLHELVDAGLPPMAALQAATRNAARALNWDESVGTIEAGKIADLVILDGDPLGDITNVQRVWMVVARGRILDRDSLLSQSP